MLPWQLVELQDPGPVYLAAAGLAVAVLFTPWASAQAAGARAKAIRAMPLTFLGTRKCTNLADGFNIVTQTFTNCRSNQI